MVTEAFEILDKELTGREWVAGDSFGVADAALFYVTRWAPQVGIELPSNVAAHLRRMRQRPDDAAGDDGLGRVLNRTGAGCR